MNRTILLITLATLFIIGCIAVGLVWAQVDDVVIWPIPTTPTYDTVPVDSRFDMLSPRAYLPVMAMDVIKPTPGPTSTPAAIECDICSTGKVTICHNPGPEQQTITIACSAWPAHRDHGDYCGECNLTSNPTPTPPAQPNES